MDPRKKKQYTSFLGVVFFVIIFVFALLFIGEKLRNYSPFSKATPIVTVITDTGSSSPLTVSVRVISTECEDMQKIDYSLVELSVSNGTPPYTLTITNSKAELSGPYTIMSNNSPVKIKVYGGDYFSTAVRSDIGEIWSGTIGLPSDADVCKVTPTDIESITSTPEPMNTEIVVIGPTLTLTTNPIFYATVTKTRRPVPANTSTSTLQIFVVTNPPLTNTPQPQFTDIPRPTDTSRPQPTVIPTVINPNPRECEDGIDNDNDGDIDYPADSDCNKPSDSKEGKGKK